MTGNDSTGETTMIRTLSTTATFVATVILLLGLLGGGTAWAQYPPAPGEATFVVSTPGATITIDGNNWASARVTVVRRNGTTSVSPASADGTAYSTTLSADSSGRLEPLALPADLEAGDYDLVIEGTDTAGEEQSETTQLAIQDVGNVDAASAEVPAEGVSNLELLAAVAVVVGVGLVAGRRRRV